MALPLEKVIGKRSGIDRSFRNGNVKPWQTEGEQSTSIHDSSYPVSFKKRSTSLSREGAQTENRAMETADSPKENLLSHVLEQNIDSNKMAEYSKGTTQLSKGIITTSEQQDNEREASIFNHSGSFDESANRQLTNSKQTANKLDGSSLGYLSEILEALLKLSRQQRTLFFYIHERCLENDAHSSGPIESHIFSNLISSSNNTVRTQLQRLVAKKLLWRLPGKPGPGGFHVYSIPNLVIRAGNELRRHLLKNNKQDIGASFDETANKQLTNSKQTANKLANKALPSSSSNLIETTTTSANLVERLDLEGIDVSPLREIGLQKSHLAQIKKRTDLSSELIQASINHFAFDLKTNQKAEQLKGPPLNFFMGILTKGIPYNPPDNFQDEKIKALREFNEKQKLQKEKLMQVEEEAKEAAFENWLLSMTQEQKKNLLPPILRGSDTSEKNKRFALKGNFIEKEWPVVREKILRGER